MSGEKTEKKENAPSGGDVLPVASLHICKPIPLAITGGQSSLPTGIFGWQNPFAMGHWFFDNLIVQTQVPDDYDTFTEEQVAEQLGVTESTIRYYTKRTKLLAYVPLGHGRRVVLRKDLRDFLERKRVASTDEVMASERGKT